MTKIALEMQRARSRALEGGPGRLAARTLAQGQGWVVQDVVCSCGPKDRPFEEQHRGYSIAVVLAGSFQYRASGRSSACGELMTPGAILLGNPGQTFECSHEHASGDRCLAFHYSPELFERVAADAGVRGRDALFPVLKLSPERPLAPMFYDAALAVRQPSFSSEPARLFLEEFSLRLAAQALRSSQARFPDRRPVQPSAIARVTGVLRMIEENIGLDLTLSGMARRSGLSPFHFLRTFEHATGLTPRKYVRRLRLAEAAVRLSGGREKALDVAVDCGFNDASNFSRVFHAEIGITPTEYRKRPLSMLCRSSRLGGSF